MRCPECGATMIIYPAEGFIPQIIKCEECGLVFDEEGEEE